MSSEQTSTAAGSDAAATRPAPAGPGVGWLRRLGPYIVRYKRTVIATLIFSVIAQTLIALLPLIQEIIVDHSIIGYDRAIGPLLVILVLTGMFGLTTNFARRYLGAKISVDI